MANWFTRLFGKQIPLLGMFHEQIRLHLPRRGVIADLGCGDNCFLSAYRRESFEVWGMDFHRHPLLKHRDWFRLLPPDGKIPFPDASFDMVVSKWVLEHVDSPRVFMNEVARVLRPGGSFVSLSINGAHYVTWLARLLHLLPHSITQRLIHRLFQRPCHDTFPTYYRLNTRSQLASAARQSGLRLVSLQRRPDAGYFAFSANLFNLAALTDYVLNQIQPGLGDVFFVSVMRKPIEDEANRYISRSLTVSLRQSA